MRLQAFIEMLRQMSSQFTISQIVKVVFVLEDAAGITFQFMLHMQNGEYWAVSNVHSSPFSGVLQFGTFQLMKFLPPIPTFSQLPDMKTAVNLIENPTDLNIYLRQNNSSETMYLPDKDREQDQI